MFNDDNFDKMFTQNWNNIEKMHKRAWRLGVVMLVVYVSVGLSVLGLLGYVIWHFLAKVW